jgi:hypothetical protein
MFQGLANDIPTGAFRFFSHGTGIDDQEICRLAEFDDMVTIASQAGLKHSGFRLVQATAQRME